MTEAGMGGLCAACGRDLVDEDASTRPYCAQCALDGAERQLQRRSMAAEAANPDRGDALERKRATRKRVMWAIAAVVLGVFLWRIPAFVAVLEPPASLYSGNTKVDASAPDCIAQLWKASADVSEGRDPSPDLRCPASGLPYVVSRESDVITVACPDPEQHGLGSLTVDSVDQVPEVRAK